MDKREIRKVNTDEIEGEYILKNTAPGKKKIIFSTVIWFDPESDKYYFKSESDMNGNRLAGQVVSHKLIQDLLSISKWMVKPIGESWKDPDRIHSGGIDTEYERKYKTMAGKRRRKDDDGAGYADRFSKWTEEDDKHLRKALKRQADQKKSDEGPKYAGAPYNRAEDEEAIKAALDRLRRTKEFSCLKCGKWIANVGDGLHDTCEEEWKTFEKCGLCSDCWTNQKHPNETTEKFQRSMDEFRDAVNGDTEEDTR